MQVGHILRVRSAVFFLSKTDHEVHGDYQLCERLEEGRAPRTQLQQARVQGALPHTPKVAAGFQLHHVLSKYRGEGRSKGAGGLT